MNRTGTKCRYCRQPIRWETNDYTGRPVPLDPYPDRNGTWAIETNGNCLELGPQGLLAHRGLLYTRHNCEPGRKAMAA